MDPFEKKRLLPIEVMIALAINLVVAILGYYAIMMCSEAEESCGERLPSPHGRLSGRDLTAWATAKDTGSGSA